MIQQTQQHERFQHALELEKNGNMIEAFHEYIGIIRENGQYRNAYLNLGSLYSRADQPTLALYCFKKALALGEDYLTLFNIGCIFYKKGEYKKAIQHFEKSKAMQRNFPLSMLVMGLCYSRLENIRAAETNFRDVLEVWPRNRVACTALAIIYYNADRFGEALEFVDKVLGQDARNASLRELRFNILYKTDRLEESRDAFKSLQKISDGCQYYDNFIKSVPVEVYTDRYGTLDEKIEFLEEQSVEDNGSLISLSLCHMFKGETDRALDYLFEAKRRYNASLTS